MQCVVTGGAGFIGSHVVDLLISEGHTVRVVDNLMTGKRANLNRRADFLEGDIRDLAFLERSFQEADVVFHLAALPRIQPSFEDPAFHEDVNVVGTLRVFEAARICRVKKLVYSSSSACYGTPTEFPTTEKATISCLSPYALQKYTAEQYLLILGARYAVPVVALRYFNVYGPRSFNEFDRLNAYSSVIGIFKNQRDKAMPLTVTGDGEQKRDFVHVYDVARANLAAALSSVANDVFNVGCGQSYTINEIAKLFGGRISYIPERKGEALITLADISKTSRILGWTPKLSLQEGLKYL